MKFTKKRVRKISVCLALALLTLPTIAQSGWVDDWITNKSAASPSSFQGATRGYYTGGSFQAHWKNSNDYLMTASIPHIKSGCGGIDTFMGGFAFMDVDYLVQKLQRIMSAAPAAAFDLALKAVSEQIAGTLKELGAWSDALNNLQLDDCKASKALVATIASPASSMFSDKMQSEISTAQSDFWTSSGMGDLYTRVKDKFTSEQKDVASGAATTAPTVQATAQGSISGCPSEIVDLYGQGSFLDNVAAKKGLSSTYVSLIRGFIGDVEIFPPSVTGSTFLARTIDSCDENASAVAFVTGETQAKSSTSSACAPITDTNKSLINYTTNMLTNIIGKMKSKTPYSTDEENFLALLPSGMFSYLKVAAITKMDGATVQELSNVASNAIAYYLLTDLFYRVQQLPNVIAHINSSGQGAKSGADPATCQLSLLNPTKAQFEVILERIRTRMDEVHQNYLAVLAEANTIGTLQQRMQKAEDTVYSELKGRFTKGIADHIARQ